MKLIVCLDDKNGMLFNKRRQSSDCSVCTRILELAGTDTLWMNGYSAKLFPQKASSIRVSSQFLQEAKPGEYCFVEDQDILPHADHVEALIIYRWNRQYPSDMKFPIAHFEEKWRLVRQTDFPGNSHKKITEEIYAL